VATYDDDLRLAHVLADAVERITMSRFRAEDLVVESKPDLTLVLDLPVETGLARAASRSGDENRFEKFDAAFHERLRQAFLDIAKRAPDRCTVIDASGTEDEVAEAILAAAARRFGLPVIPG